MRRQAQRAETGKMCGDWQNVRRQAKWAKMCSSEKCAGYRRHARKVKDRVCMVEECTSNVRGV
eukprot:3960177-Pleurochrysis_carterae.AAC.1